MRTKTITLIVMLLYIMGIQAQTSKVNVTIDGPGVVDEYLTTSADGKKQVKLKAIPSKFLGNVTFDGWSGDATGTSEELTVDADKAQNIQATFTYHRPVKKYPLVELKKSWADMGKPMYYEMPTIWETQDNTLWRGTNYLPVDYNRDGYIDYVQFAKKGGMGIDNHREKVRFWLGKPDGSFEEDPKNDNRLTSTVYSIEMKYADFNNDGYPDFCSFSSGYDRLGSTGDYPVVLMSSPDGVYSELRYTDFSGGYFHGGTTGDFDNDGDIDALFWDMWSIKGLNSLYLENDGNGRLIPKKATELLDFSGYFATLPSEGFVFGMDAEVIDLNNDGYNDIIFCGHDHSDKAYGYPNPPIVFWGSSSGKFGGTNYSLLPPPRLGYGVTTSFCFYDFNGDGVKEIIVEKNGDAIFGDSRFYVGGYLQVCEWENGKYVDKTEKYIPVEHQAYNKQKSECRTSIENIDGTDYYTAYEIDQFSRPGLEVGRYKLYAIRNGIMESLEHDIKTKIQSFDEGFPIYVDGPELTDGYGLDDGVNPVDTMPEHAWVEISDWDSTHGNMWRINLHHRENTHFGRTCIRWNRDGLDPKKKEQHEDQSIRFSFLSDVDIENLIYEDCYLEFFIKNSDPDLSFLINGTVVDVNNTDEGRFIGEWQRVTCPLTKIVWGGNTFNSLWISVDKGDLNNEFYLDDIRIRRLSISETRDEYSRAFEKGYVSGIHKTQELTKQITSQEFKALLKPLVERYAPDSIGYFNSRITDYDVPISRGTAAMMAYYIARCIDATEENSQYHRSSGDNFWDGAWGSETDQLLPFAQTALVGSQEGWQESIYALLWNAWHVSPFSNKEVIEYVSDAEGYAWAKAFTWEAAICAITRLYDSMDPEKVAAGISTLKINPDSQSGVYYNLQGQRVENPVKGVYIKNGKKIIYK